MVSTFHSSDMYIHVCYANPCTNLSSGHHNRVPQPHSTQPEPSPVLPANSITMATQHHGQSASSLATPTIATLSPSPARPRGMSRSRRLSLDPHVRLRVDKLEVVSPTRLQTR